MREHPFSMSSSAEHTDLLAFSIKESGDFTSKIKEIEPGTKAFLDGPYGVFTTNRYWDSAGFFLIAGGIGITPMMSMLSTAADRKDDRPFTLIYANNTWEEVTFREEIEELKDKLDLSVVYVIKDPSEDWQGETGYVDKELLARYLPIHRGTRQYFICAAPKMMNSVESALHQLDVPITNIHMEHFNLV